MMRIRLHIGLALALVGCGAPSVDLPDAGGLAIDAGSAPRPARPQLEPVAPRVPYPVITLRGATTGRRIIVEGGPNPQVKATVGGAFCVDVPLPSTGTYNFTVYAQGQDGQLSEAAPPVNVERDPGAPRVQGATTCSGADPAGCAGAVELCGNQRDDDCNNLSDGDDPACQTCRPDVLEPNDAPGAPRIDPGRYEDLSICPGDRDHFGIFARRGETIDARIRFTHARGDLDAYLIGLDRRTPLARGLSIDDDEAVTHTATVTGEYRLEVFGVGEAVNGYDLTLDVRAGR
jgi:hypothetical protein